MLHGFDGQQDGTNAFIFSRYLVPELQGYEGFALFCDGDMHVNGDIYNLWELKDEDKAIQVVPHNYKTQHELKYIGTKLQATNVNYPRKNQSSVMIWNCGHPANQILNRRLVSEAGGSFLHRFQWLKDEEIGHLPFEWNWLVGEYEDWDHAYLYHHTLGSPGFEHYADCHSAKDWNKYLLNALHMESQRQTEIVRRAFWNKRVAA